MPENRDGKAPSWLVRLRKWLSMISALRQEYHKALFNEIHGHVSIWRKLSLKNAKDAPNPDLHRVDLKAANCSLKSNSLDFLPQACHPFKLLENMPANQV